MRWLGVLLSLFLAGVGVAVGGVAAAAQPTVSVVQDAKLGPILVGPNGMTLYLYMKDTANVSNCSGGCAAAWPPLTVTGTPTAGTGVAGTLGTTKRADGSMQVTYDGWPLYYYAADTKAGDTTGQGVGSVWYVVAPTQAAAPGGASGAESTAPSSTAAPAAANANTVAVAQNAQLGSVLVGPNGMTLYIFKKDSANVSNCSGKCAAAWPPLTVTGTPSAGAGAAGPLGTIKRADASTQVTYNGWPLYYYAADAKAGDATGQGVGSVWYVATPTMAAATAAVADAAATLPKTGGSPWPEAAGVVLLAAGAGLMFRTRMRRRRAAA